MMKWIARSFLRLTGWEAEGERPTAKRFVVIAAPHTSNWDLAYLLAFAVLYDVKISWMGKHVLFAFPLGILMRRLGGVPIDRRRSGNIVTQMVERFDRSESLALVVPVEGTRSYVPHWKSGFYHIAKEAGVPIVPTFLDYERRIGGFGPELLTTGDVREDMDELRDFYADKRGKFPERFGEVRLKEEM